MHMIVHALRCSRGSFPSICHNKIRDITADLLREVCHSIGMKPRLQHVTEEQLTYRSANKKDNARLDIVATSFWRRDGSSSLSSQATVILPYLNATAETKSRSKEHNTNEYIKLNMLPSLRWYSPTSGGMAPTANVVYKRIAPMITSKYDKIYSRTMYWIQCKVNFPLIHIAIMCLC